MKLKMNWKQIAQLPTHSRIHNLVLCYCTTSLEGRDLQNFFNHFRDDNNIVVPFNTSTERLTNTEIIKLIDLQSYKNILCVLQDIGIFYYVYHFNGQYRGQTDGFPYYVTEPSPPTENRLQQSMQAIPRPYHKKILSGPFYKSTAQVGSVITPPDWESIARLQTKNWLIIYNGFAEISSNVPGYMYTSNIPRIIHTHTLIVTPSQDHGTTK